MKIFILLILVSILAPDGKGGGIRKQINFLLGIVLCLVLFSPLVKALGQDITLPVIADKSEEMENGLDEAEKSVIEGGVKIICEELEGAVEQIYGISDAHLTLELDTEDSASIKIISARLSGKGDLRGAVDYISKTLLCPVTFGTAED